MNAALRLCCKPLLFVVFLGALLFAGRATAQRGSEMAKAAASLPADSRAVVDRLEMLHELPAGVWKMHAGDVAHGEDTNLDDSAWQPVGMGEKAPNEAVWFRESVQVPETL
ncbi:MAG: hypothetical protein P4L87_19790, partial [Formivibrio sp.]|nr:hypothetical protein [Formivibrio sp.]